MTLDEVRTKIDDVDQELLRLLNERANLVHTVGEIKRKEGLEIYAPDREEKLLKKLIELNNQRKGRLPEKSIRAIYREIISAALALEQDMRIGYLGPAGSWTHQAAVSRFGNSVLYLPEASTEDVFERVSTQEADYGVLPIEHSTEGAVHHTLDHLVDVLREGKADAVLAASIFHFGEYTVGDVKQYLARHAVPIRLPEKVGG